MTVSRRSFVATLGASVGAGAAGMLTAPLLTWRGHEQLLAQQGTPAAAEPHAERLIASQPGMIRLDSNENPNGPGARASDAIVHQLGQTNRYPVKETDDLTQRIAAVQSVKPENVLLGCGSGELLRAAVYAFTSSSLALAEPEPTFEAPGNFARFMGRAVNAPPVDDKLATDLDTLTSASRNAGLVYFCNPNNPTAAVHKASDVAAFVEQVMRTSPDAVVLVDEAYHEYVADPGYATAIPIALANPRVVVTRTFSKVFGMAGLRVGYAIGQPAALQRMEPWLLGSNVNQLALAAATATIGDTAHVAAEVKRNAAARAYTRHFFESAGYTVPAADANFMMVDIRRDPKAFKLACAKHKVAIGRRFPSLPTYARISVGTLPEMRKATVVFRTVLAEQVSSSSH
jgi:histidinol-phosphate aminotransferase